MGNPHLHPGKRLALVSVACVALLMSLVAGCVSQPLVSSTAASEHAVIVRIVSRHGVITVTTGPTAPLYTVADAYGHVMVSGVTLASLKKTRPDLYEQVSTLVSPEAESWAGDY